MIEKFASKKLEGSIEVKLKYDNDMVKVWRAEKSDIVVAIIAICKQYMREGYVLSLRQLYYQLVSRDLVPNHMTVYKKISAIKDDIFYSGLVDWNAFEDRGRVPRIAYFEDSVLGSLERTHSQYKLDRQLEQKTSIEVWTEKDAISGILEKVTKRYTVRLVINKGYNSSTAMYNAYERFIQDFKKGKKVVVLYFGDHDPSGLDMVRDIRKRLMFMFCQGEQMYAELEEIIDEWWYGSNMSVADCFQAEENQRKADRMHKIFSEGIEGEKFDEWFFPMKLRLYIDHNELFEIKHIGLTQEQIAEYNPPPNPAKMTDPRADKYIAEFGRVSWEVDAIKPNIMRRIVQHAIEEEMNMEKYDAILAEEKANRKELRVLIDQIKKEEHEGNEEE